VVIFWLSWVDLNFDRFYPVWHPKFSLFVLVRPHDHMSVSHDPSEII